MNLYNIYFEGRVHGTIGRFTYMVVSYYALTVEDARKKFWEYAQFEVNKIYIIKRVEK